LSVEDLAAASSKQILVRMLNNLRTIYLEIEDYGRALSVLDRIVLLVGESPKLRRDRGLLFARLKMYGNAWADLSAYLRSDDASELADLDNNEEMTLLRDQLERVRRLAADPN
jgi:regulator of sirC expression with transglutaminase-like and TPR domain